MILKKTFITLKETKKQKKRINISLKSCSLVINYITLLRLSVPCTNQCFFDKKRRLKQ